MTGVTLDVTFTNPKDTQRVNEIVLDYARLMMRELLKAGIAHPAVFSSLKSPTFGWSIGEGGANASTSSSVTSPEGPGQEEPEP
jgi:hypothetical protein